MMLETCHTKRKFPFADDEVREPSNCQESTTNTEELDDDKLHDGVNTVSYHKPQVTKLGYNKALMSKCILKVFNLGRGQAYTPNVPKLAYKQADHALVEPLLNTINYGEKYSDDMYEYRHVKLPKKLMALVPTRLKGKLLTEFQWRSLGIQMSPGWEHYLLHRPEPHIFLFRREQDYSENYGNLTAEQFKKVKKLHDYFISLGQTHKGDDKLLFKQTSPGAGYLYDTVQEWIGDFSSSEQTLKTSSQQSVSLRYAKGSQPSSIVECAD